MNDFDEKNKLIDQIRWFHPGERPEKFRHFGWYVGGMKDDGDWSYETMIKSSMEDLQECFALLNAKAIPPKEL